MLLKNQAIFQEVTASSENLARQGQGKAVVRWAAPMAENEEQIHGRIGQAAHHAARSRPKGIENSP
jgi:hypothetical protein